MNVTAATSTPEPDGQSQPLGVKERATQSEDP